MATVPAAQLQRLAGVLAAFPAVRHAFAYGSGVLPQPGLYDSEGAGHAARDAAGAAHGAPSPSVPPSAASPSAAKGPMLDFIFAVDDPREWHAQASSRHPLSGRGPARPKLMRW